MFYPVVVGQFGSVFGARATPSRSDPCVYTTADNTVQYHEMACLYDAYGAVTMEFEKHYDPMPGLAWMRAHHWVPITACVLYGVMMVLGRRYFVHRPRWHWTHTLAVWNITLALFSALGFVRTAPRLWYTLRTFSVQQNFCQDPRITFGSGSSGLWTMLFVFSKFPELLDTFFIIIHKKPLIFLHWYHHVTVLLYCWYTYTTAVPIGFPFGTVNYGVHAIMYFYYALMAMRIKPKWFQAKYITVAQISQMFVGVGVTCLAVYYRRGDPTCAVTSQNLVAAMLMYGSYLVLFMQFFISRYMQPAAGKVTLNGSSNSSSVANGSTKRKSV